MGLIRLRTGLAQLVEHWSPKPGVGSSSLSTRAQIKTMSIINFIKESVTELRDNVKWTSRSELLNLSALVIVFSVIFSLVIWGADSVLSRIVKLYFNLIG